MGYWNHRVVRRTYDRGKSSQEVLYSIHEAYYGIDGDINPAITVEPVAPCGESVEVLREDLRWMLRALDKPVLDYETREEIQSRLVPQADGYSDSGTLPQDATWIGEIDGKKYTGLNRALPLDHLPEGTH
jgi:hypothetical protein